MTVAVGDQAPDFELKDQTGQPVRLSDYHEKKAVVLVFFPFSFSAATREELGGIRDELDVFASDDVATIAVSVDSPFAHRAFAEQEGLDFPILSDFWPHGEVARTYGVFNEQSGVPERATFVIDRDGTVVHREQHGLADARDREPWRQALRDIGAL